MSYRSLLRDQLNTAWQETVNSAYPDQLINSERGLQFYFCQQLLLQFQGDKNRRIFVEPRFKRDGSTPISPDVVICNARDIIGIVELKYGPRAKPTYTKDLDTLCWFAENNIVVTVSNNRYLGAGSTPKEYNLAADAVLCWAGVYRGTEHLCFKEEKRVQAIDKRFHCLHAITSQGKRAKLLFGDRENVITEDELLLRKR
jgi:hypothetical protein